MDFLSLLLSLRLTSNNLDLVRMKLLGVVVELKVDVLDDEGPDLVAKPINVEVALRMHVSESAHLYHAPAPQIHIRTLKVIRALTFSPSTEAMCWSKLAMMRIASCGSMRRLLIRSSSVSARATPMLYDPVSDGLRHGVGGSMHTKCLCRARRSPAASPVAPSSAAVDSAGLYRRGARRG